MADLLASLWRRARRKSVEVAPLVVGALVWVGVMSAVVFVLEPYLPGSLRPLLQHARHGDWAASQADLRALFGTYGTASTSLFVLAQILQVLVAPIPGQVLGLLGGSLYGFVGGLLLNLLGLAIGSVIAMGSSRVLGDVVVRRFVSPSILARFDHLTGATGLWSFFLIFLLPIFPDDAICFMAGMTRLPLHRLVLVCLLGRLPGIAVLTFVGSGGSGDPRLSAVVFGVAMVLACVVWLFSDELEDVVRQANWSWREYLARLSRQLRHRLLWPWRQPSA
jgi:uncharacterized membrane protein YdjX (TVP38/TMEM64 family)